MVRNVQKPDITGEVVQGSSARGYMVQWEFTDWRDHCFPHELKRINRQYIKKETNFRKAYTYTYNSWSAMRQRCTDPNHLWYKIYGGRGIKTCKRWEKFENFLRDMGPRPQGLTLERKNGNRNYTPGNCKWADIHEQNTNRSNMRSIKTA